MVGAARFELVLAAIQEAIERFRILESAQGARRTSKTSSSIVSPTIIALGLPVFDAMVQLGGLEPPTS